MPMISLLKTEKDIASSAKGAEMLIRRLLLPFGGGEFFFCPGEKAALIVDASLPAENDTGANFDIRLLWAVIHIAQEEGVEELSICFRPEAGFDAATVLARSGYDKLADIPGIKLVDLSCEPVSPKTTDTGLVLEKADIYQVFAKADVVISLAKFKTAEGMLFGGALANAALTADISEDMELQMKQRAAADVYSIMAPDLTIADCIIGTGGFQNNNISCVVAGSDGVAVDTVLCAMGNVDPRSHETLVITSQYGMGVSDPADITMFGDDMGEIMAGGKNDKKSTESMLS